MKRRGSRSRSLRFPTFKWLTWLGGLEEELFGKKILPDPQGKSRPAGSQTRGALVVAVIHSKGMEILTAWHSATPWDLDSSFFIRRVGK